MKLTFKPFNIQTGAYFGAISHNNPCNDDNKQEYQTSFSRAIFYLTRQGHFTIESIFNNLKINSNYTISKEPTFMFNGDGKTLLEYLTEE